MAVQFWPTSLPQSVQMGFSAQAGDARHVFESDVGEPISRPRTTGAIEAYEAAITLTGDDIAAFSTFFHTDLSQGTQRFIFRDPDDGAVRWWKFAAPPRRQVPISRVAQISMSLLKLPGTPWFADYVPAGVSRVPYFVADYANAAYGIDGETVAASALPTIAGTYLVERTTATAVTSAIETLVATDIPATAPGTTTKILGFET